MDKKLPKDVYYRCISVARGYKAQKKRYMEQEEMILYGSAASDGMPHGNSVGNPTARSAERLLSLHEKAGEKIEAVENALQKMEDDAERDLIRKRYFDGMKLSRIVSPMSYPTKKRVSSRFLVYLAEELGEI